MLCGNLDGKEIWGRMDTCIFMAGSLYCSPETVTTLFVNLLYLNIKCVFFFKEGKCFVRKRGKGWWCLVDLSLSPLYPLSSWAILLTLTLSTSLVAQLVKNPCVMQQTPVQSLVWDDPLEEGLTTHSSILVWRIPTDKGDLAGCRPWGSKKSNMTEHCTTVSRHSPFSEISA